jgi:hypothetical protein
VADAGLGRGAGSGGQVSGAGLEEGEVRALVAPNQGGGDFAAIGQAEGNFFVALNDMAGGDDQPGVVPHDTAGRHPAAGVDGDHAGGGAFDRVRQVVRDLGEGALARFGDHDAVLRLLGNSRGDGVSVARGPVFRTWLKPRLNLGRHHRQDDQGTTYPSG